ncbi:P-loop containing nucleoside triphosphate hydrolase protein [Lactarius psammicola]|nr:P-loop containing nucleoside triphosphate hydrolase protein [Lactarius psammicola]
MTLRNPCSICCSSCTSGSVPSLRNDSVVGSLSVQNLLPAGTLSLPISQTELGSICNHSHSVEDWHPFLGEALLPYLTDHEDETLCRHLSFLVEHKFLFVQCSIGDSGKVLVLRTYIIPYDLPGAQGKLRVRDEASILKPARLCLRNVVPRILQDEHLWDAHDSEPSSSSPRYFLNPDTDNRTLAEIYSDLPSPVLDINPQTLESSGLNDMIHEVILGQQIAGLRSKLYPYQRESVSAMIVKEMDDSVTPDPLYIPITGLDKTVFYLQPATMEILRERPMVATHHGGILCEELGTGKTIMTLALVLATIDQLSKPEESIHDARPVMTPLAFRHFPDSKFEASRKRLSRGRASISTHHLHLRRNVEWLQNRGLQSLLDLNSPFYLQSEEPVTSKRSRRKDASRGFRKMYLTSATLIVVPPNLLAQWNSEILKHCLGPDETDDALRFLIVKPKDELPSVRVLASDYDIVLLNHETFAREVSKIDNSKTFTWNVCKCPGYKGTRVPDCKCDDSSGVSPLFRIRWKRLVVDEGHVHGTDKTHISKVASLLSVERRWLVTGTPTTNLLGINLRGQELGTELQYPGDDSEEDDILPPWEDLDPGSPGPGSSHVSSREALVPRTWTRYDREDLRRLGTMMITFLQIPRFSAETGLFRTHVVHSLFGSNGPHPGAIQVLTQVMNSIMIRHQIQDIETDVSLPPLTQETVLLDLDPLAVKSYNALQAVITINAVDSERKDQDYLFHPNNAAYLRQLVANMSQLMFWHVDDRQYNVDELVKTADTMVERAQERGVSPKDLDALREAKTHIILAANDTLWRATQANPTPEIPFVVDGVPRPVLEAWTEHSSDSPPAFTTSFLASCLMFPQRLLVNAGRAQADEDKTRNALFLQSIRKKAKATKKHGAEENARETRKAEEAARQNHDKVLEIQNELRLVFTRRPNPTWANTALANTRMITSRSSKLNYLLKEVLEHSRKEKFLIFSSMPLTLAHVADALTLAGVMYLQYTTASPVHVRQQYVMTFETSDKYRVFLMELKHGSRGLNLISASRVIFCEPVWQADVEAQAIKRVHRIGQTRPISVKTLAIRNSAEELMISRSAQLKGQDQKVTYLTDDFTMRDFIANPRFMQGTEYEPLTLNIPLLEALAGETSRNDTEAPVDEIEGVNGREESSEEQQRPTTEEEQHTLKKRRTIRFAE